MKAILIKILAISLTMLASTSFSYAGSEENNKTQAVFGISIEDQLNDWESALRNHKIDVVHEQQYIVFRIPLDNIFILGTTHKISNSDIHIKQVADILNTQKNVTIEVNGHTDDRGSQQHNLQLSKDHADQVARLLENSGLTNAMISHSGYGEKNPISNNATAKGRHANRRIEIKIDMYPQEMVVQSVLE